jgi:hypothetical protein
MVQTKQHPRLTGSEKINLLGHIGAVQTADELISGESKWVLAWSKEEKRMGKITPGVGAVHTTHTKRNEDRAVHRDRLTSKSQQPRSDISYE